MGYLCSERNGLEWLFALIVGRDSFCFFRSCELVLVLFFSVWKTGRKLKEDVCVVALIQRTGSSNVIISVSSVVM